MGTRTRSNRYYDDKPLAQPLAPLRIVQGFLKFASIPPGGCEI